MANPSRRTSYLHVIPTNIPPSLTSQQQQQQQSATSAAAASLLSSLAVFLKRPHAFPFLLTIFVLLTWISLRFQSSSHHRTPPFSSFSSATAQSGGASKGVDGRNVDAILVRFSSLEFPSQIFRDKRGWLINPVTAAQEAGISGGAQSCASVHVGEIRPGGLRGNHRHHTCNETFIIWGAETKFRLENPHAGEKGYSEVTIGADEVAVAASLSGTAHALINTDSVRTTFILGCQDSIPDYNSSTTDFNVWKDL